MCKPLCDLPILTRLTLIVSFIGAAFFSSRQCEGQAERYELGKRLRRFEESWQVASPEIQKRSAPVLQAAVSKFFSLDLLSAAEKLDQAWITTQNEKFDSWQEWAIPLRIQSSAILFDSSTQEITFSLKRFYQAKEAIPDNVSATVKVRWSIVDAKKSELLKKECSIDEAMQGTTISLEGLQQGDFRVIVVLESDSSKFQLPSLSISRVDNLEDRLTKVIESARNQQLPLNDTVRATLRDHVSLMNQVIRGNAAETDYPFFQMLEFDERLSAEPDSYREIISVAAGQQDLWLSLALGRNRVSVRLRAPSPEVTASYSGKPMPVLFLMHGAGGSENMFFETYGAGQAVEEGLKRGWLVVAPRQGFTGLGLDCEQMLQALELLFEVDRKQVYLVGHSMGAAQVIRQASAHPQLPKAAAVIGGGSGVRDANSLANIAWYVSAGQLDFGRAGAKAFHQSMKSAGAPQLKYQEFEGIEHLVIVQACLKDMFEYFDQANK